MNGTPTDMLGVHVRAFETQRAGEVVPFCELPCTFIRPDGTWVAQDEATALTLVNHLLDHAKSQGYDRTEIVQTAGRRLANGLAEVAGVFVRFNAAGAEIARFGFTYILRGGPQGRRIVVAVAHDAQPHEALEVCVRARIGDRPGATSAIRAGRARQHG